MESTVGDFQGENYYQLLGVESYAIILIKIKLIQMRPLNLK
jgi:hypothetical protein